MYKIESPEDGGKWPKGPNFLLIVALACLAALVLFGVAYFVIPGAASSMRHVAHPARHPNAQLVLKGNSSLPV